MESIDSKILEKIKKAKRGSLFYTEDFLSFGNYKAVSKALERLVNTNEISRVSRGIFAVLEKDPIIGEVYPSTEEIAESIRKRDKARLIPTGVLALNALGLSTQIPMNLVYLTDEKSYKNEENSYAIIGFEYGLRKVITDNDNLVTTESFKDLDVLNNETGEYEKLSSVVNKNSY